MICLLRHGRTQANERRLYCGKTDLPLSPEGRSELSRFRDKGIYPEVGVHITSGLKRARETLEIIYGAVPSIELPGLAEYDFGEFEMKSYDQLRENPEYLAWILDETGDVPCPSGESRNANRSRVLGAFRALESCLRGGESAAVVCHGGTITVIMSELFHSERNFYDWQPKPGRGYMLSSTGGGKYEYSDI